MMIVWALISYKMLRTVNLLDWDERYYLSIAATASGGHGLYPALQNYPSMPIMGGIGHVNWIYALAYQILGPSLYSLRFVALLFSFLTLPAIFLLFRRWYGSVTAWLAITLLPMTLLFISAFSIRIDIFTIVCLWWSLLLVDVAREKNTWRWHLAVGLYLGLCLQVHIHTSIMAIAVGILYLIDYAAQIRQSGRWKLPQAVLIYSLGALIGLGLYVVANILPDPDAFFRTAGNAGRFMVVSADLETSLVDRLIKSFTAFDVFWKNFLWRWIIVFQTINPVELIFWVAGFLSLFWRRSHRATRPILVLSASAVLIGFFILNLYVLIYTTHIGPPLLLCVPPFFTYGFSRRVSFEWKDLSPGFVLVIATCILPIYITSVQVNIVVPDPDASQQFPYEETMQFVTEHVSTTCRLIGSDGVFIYGLPMYSLYHSGENVSAGSGRRYYNYDSDEHLWEAISPDVAILTPDLTESFKTWLDNADYEEIFPAVWRKTQADLSPDCVITP